MAALDRLPAPMRSSVVLVALQGLTHDQAGKVLGRSSGTIAWRIHEARKRLASAVEAERSGAKLESLVPVFGL